jgi:hypothetical protein
MRTVCPARPCMGVTFMPGADTMVGVTTRTPDDGLLATVVVIFWVAAAAAAKAAMPDMPEVVGVLCRRKRRRMRVV